jgi:hypothetical protein
MGPVFVMASLMIVTACLVGYDTLNAVGERLLADQIFNAVLPADPLRSKAASKSRSAANPQNFLDVIHRAA